MPNTAFSPFGSTTFGSGFPELGDLDFSGYGSSVFKDSVPGYGGQVFTPSPEKPGNSFAQTALGVGALAEGIGNVIRGIKGMDPAPPGMATSALASFFQQQPDTSLERILDRLLSETQSKFRREDQKDDRLMRSPSASPQPAA
jgi:hypothetical protein